MGPFPEYATLARPPIYAPSIPWNEALRICMESAGGSFCAGSRTLCVLSLSLSGGGDGLGLSEVMIANIPAISAAEIVATRPIQAAFVEEFFPIVKVKSTQGVNSITKPDVRRLGVYGQLVNKSAFGLLIVIHAKSRMDLW